MTTLSGPTNLNRRADHLVQPRLQEIELTPIVSELRMISSLIQVLIVHLGLIAGLCSQDYSSNPTRRFLRTSTHKALHQRIFSGTGTCTSR